ncbi:MAG: Hsp20/alpha crystallin family protein [Candidatus Latescibacterota bacterium]|jgi:HSP20 family protein
MTTDAIQKQEDTPQANLRTYSPRADIYKRETGYEAQIELPGVVAEALDITLERGVLTVRGQTKVASYEGYEALAGATSPLVYERSFRLTEAVNDEGVEAEFKNGLLTLVLPKAKEAQPRKIPVVLN